MMRERVPVTEREMQDARDAVVEAERLEAAAATAYNEARTRLVGARERLRALQERARVLHS